MPEVIDEKKARRTRKCREIIAVIHTEAGAGHYAEFRPVENWPAGITRADKAIAAAKKIQTDWAKDPVNAGKTLEDIVLMRRLATVKGKQQVLMSFCVE